LSCLRFIWIVVILTSDCVYLLVVAAAGNRYENEGRV
jgi:hypothetical protein